MTGPQVPYEFATRVAASGGVPGAVIVGGAHGSLAVARSLGRHGIPVWYVSHDHPITGYSRYTKKSLTWDGPNSEHAADWLIELAKENGLDGWLLVAGADPEVRLVARHYAELAATYRVVGPAWPVARITCDKQATYQHAASVGVATPLSFYPRSREEAAAVACDLPAILKPTIHRGRNPFTSAKAWRVDDRAALLARYDAAAALVGCDGIILQELIPGGSEAQFSYAAVWNQGVPVASLVARRTRQYPVDFGFTSTFVETVEAPIVADAACRFLAPLQYSGLVEVEFKHDARDGCYKLLDVNPRPWTWIALGGAAGLDLPLIQWQLAQGESVTTARARPGVAWCHTLRDFISAWQQIASGAVDLRDYAKSMYRPMVFAAFAIDDLVPGFVDLPVVLARVLSRRLTGTPDVAPVRAAPAAAKTARA